MADEKLDDTNLEDDVEYLTLEFEDGSSEQCEVLGIFDVNDLVYIALVPETDDESVYLYRYVEHEDDSFDLLDIEDDNEFENVSDVFESLVDEDFGE